MFNTIDEVYDYLYNQKKLTKRENLNRIKYAFDALNIKVNYKIIHVAGTNGKGSTCQMIKNILMLKGLHVGMFVSPYVIEFNERIQVNDRLISNSEIMYYANILYEFNEKYKKEYNDVIPFFELTLLMALMYYQDREIDYLVLECGLGGLLDSTNFLNTDLAIITNIGYDHQEQLGNTLEDISNHKLGIVKPNMTCFTACDTFLMNHFNEYAKNNNSNIINIRDNVKNISLTDDYTCFEYKDIPFKTNLLGLYQAYNASLAIEAVKYFYHDFPNELIDYALTNIFWPGRLEFIDKNIIIDGAHNISAIKELINTLKALKFKKIKIIFYALKDKNYKDMLNELNKICSKFYFTNILDTRSSNIEDFINYITSDYEIIDDYIECYKKAKDELQDDELLLITGSLHFISTMRKLKDL